MDSGRRVLMTGETLVDFLPATPGPLATVESFARRPGGAPANVAVGLARLGETPWFWTRIGDIPFGGVKDSGIGREGIGYFIEAFTTTKSIVL